MIMDRINKEYFNWLCGLISDFVSQRAYAELLELLYEVPFEYSIPMDSNRADDGVELRYRFGRERNYSDPIVASKLDHRDCSVLEMMIALAIRCEDSIMYDPDFGDRTGKWFLEMLSNLGLSKMTGRFFDRGLAEAIVDRFLGRKYRKDGKGSLFVIQDCPHDLREVEIWYQMSWYFAAKEV